MVSVTEDPSLKTQILTVCLAALCGVAQAQNPIAYQLRYSQSAAGMVLVAVTLPEPVKAPASLVMPRTYPGGYEQVPYDSFVTGVAAFRAWRKTLRVAKDADGPRWSLGQPRRHRPANRIPRGHRAAWRRRFSTPFQHPRFAQATSDCWDILSSPTWTVSRIASIELRVDAPRDGPCSPPSARGAATRGRLVGKRRDYYALGRFRNAHGPRSPGDRRLPGKIPLVMAIYAEGAGGSEHWKAGWRARRSTACRTISATRHSRNTPSNWNCCGRSPVTTTTSARSIRTAELSASRWMPRSPRNRPPSNRPATRFNYAHHMAHCWIPKRAYGAGYRPFTWEMTPVIDTIWFNEGFGDTPPSQRWRGHARGRRQGVSRSANWPRCAELWIPPRRSCAECRCAVLSREASFLYAEDFRTGMNVFARGALMAAEMDDRIRARTDGKKSLRDALRWLLRWSAENRKPFQVEDLPRYFATATGVDVGDILERWMSPWKSDSCGSVNVGRAFLPAAGFKPARPPKKAAAAKIGRPTSAPMQRGTFLAKTVTVLREPQYLASSTLAIGGR